LTSSVSASWTKLSFSSWTSSCPAPQRNNFLGGKNPLLTHFPKCIT
jgi:hypothetical protein